MKLEHGFARTLPALALGVLLVGAVACGDAEIGEECDEVGSSDECEDGAICTNEETGAVCRAICTDDAQCPADHECNGISGTNVKSCQPKKVSEPKDGG